MTVAWKPAPGVHAVQFYEGEPFLYRGISSYFAGALHRRERSVLIARRRTFDAVADRLATANTLTVSEVASRLTFIDVNAALAQFMDGGTLVPSRVERGFADLLAGLRLIGGDSPIWMYGEMVDVLCKDGNHSAAVQLEELWNTRVVAPDICVLCGYAMDGFDHDVDATVLRSVCGHHTHIIPAESFTDAPDDRTRLEHVAVLQQRARRLDRTRSEEISLAREATSACAWPMVYVIDDDAGVRASLGRLLATHALHVQTFASAEAFLAAVDLMTDGCLIVDVQLVGMEGSELQGLMGATKSPMPVIVMSGSDDPWIERESLRLGATAFLRKPFDAEALMNALSRALTRHGSVRD